MYERKVCENRWAVAMSQGVSLADIEQAEAKARQDRLRLATLVATGQVHRVRGERALTLPARRAVNLAIRPKKRKR